MISTRTLDFVALVLELSMVIALCLQGSILHPISVNIYDRVVNGRVADVSFELVFGHISIMDSLLVLLVQFKKLGSEQTSM